MARTIVSLAACMSVVLLLLHVTAHHGAQAYQPMIFTGFKAVAAHTYNSPFVIASDAECASSCVGNMAWTRQQSTGECYCINQPYGDGSINSAYADSNWNSGFYANDDSYNTPHFIMFNQRLWFTNANYLGPQSSLGLCIVECGLIQPVSVQIASTYQYSSGDCFCQTVGSTWNGVAQTYDENWGFGIMPAND